MIELAAECRRVAEEGYQLRFRYPDTNDLQEMRTDRVNAAAQGRSLAADEQLAALIDSVRTGAISLSDLDASTVAQLRSVLEGSS